MVMGLTVNSPLMRAFVSALRDGGAWEMQVCYRSVFGDRFVTTPDLINAVPGNTVPVDSCVLVGAGAFGQ